MSGNGKMSNFDWVSARGACSIRKVFEQLKLGAMDDVRAINALRAGLVCDMADNSTGDFFSVFREGNGSRTVKFSSASDDEITITNSTGMNLRVTLTLNNQGDCKLRIVGKDEELEQWQVRRMALEELFFGGNEPPRMRIPGRTDMGRI
ncbi:MAG TPA: hypothetical protein VII95_12075 [Terriglobales bacterium]|jgi:hypothetical protein